MTLRIFLKRILAPGVATMAALGLLVTGIGALASPMEQGGGGGGGGIGVVIDLGSILNATRPREPAPPPRPATTRPSCHAPWVAGRSGCYCPTRNGYVLSGGKCIKAPTQVHVPETPPDTDVVEVQECLNKAGFPAGSPDGVAGPQTLAAFSAFQQAHGLKPSPAGLHDPASKVKLEEVCNPTVAVTPAPIPVSTTPVTTRSPAPEKPVQAAQPADDNCVPPELHKMLVDNYGARPGIRSCNNSCLPRPAGMSDSEMQRLGDRFSVNWCSSCIKLAGFVPLGDILKIERLAGVTLCASPPAAQCFAPSRTVIKTYPKVRTIFSRLPVSVGNEGDIAVVVGNEDYGDALPANVNGQRDAGAVHTLLTEQLGFKDDNIIDLRNASKADLERVFGSLDTPEGELAQKYKAGSRGDVFVYVSSHGMANEETGASYLLPVDGKFEPSGEQAYSLQLLYDNLGKLGARTIMVVLETTFGRNLSDLNEPPNLPDMEVAAMPITPVPGLAVFTAGDRDQQTLEDPEFGIGLFTRYLIEGLAGKADEEPLGNNDKRIDTVELYVYTANMVSMAARKSYGLEQKPILSKIDNLVVGRLAAR